MIPSYNSANWIIQAVDSALNQGGVSVEVIVIDDGSTDNSAELVRSHRPTVRVVNKRNGGVSSARNLGIDAAKSKYIKFLDSDDILSPGSLECAVNLANSKSDSIIIGRSNIIGPAGLAYEDDSYNIPAKRTHGALVDPTLLLTQATHSSLWLIPRNLFAFGPRFPEGVNLGEEYKFSRLIVELGSPVYYMDGTLSSIRDHDGDRLSRKGREADYITQLHEIENNARLISKFENGESSVSIVILARRIWTLGRDCLRFGYEKSAKMHFSLALDLAGNRAVTGRAPYRSLAKVFGPIAAERIIGRLKVIRS